VPFPLGLERGDVDDDAAAGIGGLAQVPVSTLRGMRKYSTVRARANELGGMLHTSPLNSTNGRASKFFGSTMVELMLVKILNSSEQRMP
jgi:hypothetical protein